MTDERAPSWWLFAIVLGLTFLFWAQPRNLFAQDPGQSSAPADSSRAPSSPGGNPPGSNSPGSNSPDSDSSAPQQSEPQSGAQTVNPQSSAAEATASISGVVRDVSGAIVAGAQVILSDANGSTRSTVMSGANGEFSFSQLPPGSYRVMVKAEKLQPFQSAEIVLTPQQAYELPPILLRVASANTRLIVRPVEEVAAEQVKAEEKQRVLGIVPNFYTSFIHDAAPLTTKQKYSLVTRATFDPISFVNTGIIAGIEHARKRFPEFGQGAQGYAKRYAAALGGELSRHYLSYAVFPSLFHQDPRYFYQGSGSTGSRIVHALSFVVILRGDNGHPTPSYSFFLGSLGSALLSNVYYPRADRGAGLVFTNFGVGVAARAGGALIREFLLKQITRNVPGNGKP